MECPSPRPTQTTEFQVLRFPGHVECQIRGDCCQSHPPACFRALNSLLSGAEDMSIFFIFYNEQMPGPKAPEHCANKQEQWRFVVLSHPPNPSPPPNGGASTWSTTVIHRCARTNWVSKRCVAQRIGLCQPVPLTPRGQEVACGQEWWTMCGQCDRSAAWLGLASRLQKQAHN